MSDWLSNWLSDLGRSFEKGWEAGAPGPIGPSVGRGLFSNPFLSERDRDLQDVRTLYARVLRAHERSDHATEDAIDNALQRIFLEACEESSVKNFRWAIAVGYQPIRDLLTSEFLGFPEMDRGDWAHLTLRTMSELRSYLLRKDALLRRADEVFDLGCRAATLLLTNIFDATGENPVEEEGALQLDASALDALHDPPEHIEFAWQLFFAKELIEANLFADVRAQLERNALTACRVDPSDPNAWSTKVYLPTKAKGRTPQELVSDYLSDTPLAGLFEASVPISIPDEVRFEHTHILGGSGHGKSQLLLNFIHHDLTREQGPGLIVIDSQGDLVRTLARLSLFEPDGLLADRLILIDPADVEFPVALSMFDLPEERLAGYGPAERERLLNGVVEMYEYVFSSLLGAELTQKQGVIFRFLARLMLVIPGATLHTFLDLMEHGERFREHMRLLDGTARRFFDSEFFDPSFSATKKQIAKRLWGILANPVFERMFSQSKGKIDIYEALQSGKIILISTAKDLLRQEGAEILGRFFLAKITQAVMERATLSLSERRPVFLYIDEAQEYVDEQMALLLNQARKYRVGLTLAHQNLDQLPPALRASVMSSTSIKLAGGVSAKDARALADEMQVDPEYLQSMRKQRGKSQFACQIRNRTPRAIAISTPLGAVNALPQLSSAEFEQLMAANRVRYCTSVFANTAALEKPPDASPAAYVPPPEFADPAPLVVQDTTEFLSPPVAPA
ncbi:MAG: type IV secretion system DNA-binding domain-containing protein, partial [Deltaproteobacteria bacterium]|nr:type IV secretion system DNA-binding domain-containing protein [Deltaproteobacteria bacterium]